MKIYNLVKIFLKDVAVVQAVFLHLLAHCLVACVISALASPTAVKGDLASGTEVVCWSRA